MTNGAVLWNTRVEIRRGYGDFASFYTAGTLVRRGMSSELYNPAAQWKVQREFASEVKIRQGPLPYIRPPFEALFFSVFARWPYTTALLLWTILKLALLAAIPFIVAGRGPWKEHIPLWAVGILTLGTFPEFMDLLMGQDAPLLAFLLAISFWQLATGRDKGAGFVLGLALFKFQLVIPFVAMLWIAGRKRVLPGFATSGVAVLAISVLLVGWRGLLHYPGYLLALNRATGVGLITAENQINLRGLLTLFVGRMPYPGRIHWMLAPVALAAIAYTGLIWRKAGDRLLAEGFGLAIIAAIVTSYYAYEYDLLLLIVPLLAMRARSADAPTADRSTRYLEAAGWLLLLLMPVYWFTRVQLKAECVMTLPLLAVGAAWVRRLRLTARAEVGAGRKALAPEGPR
ncbi:MAG: glycosyltransferase family 87 protein [Terriglobales bacterium]